MKNSKVCSGVLSAVMGLLVAVAGAQELPMPTEEHAILKKDVGDWDAEIKMWAAGPDQDPFVSEGKESNRMLGGFWLVTQFEGEFVGQPFSGRGQMGYDPIKKKYVGTWVDSMSPQITNSEGTYDAKKSVLTMHSTMLDPETNKTVKTKNITTYTDASTRKFEMFSEEPDGSWSKMMQIDYKRRKK